MQTKTSTTQSPLWKAYLASAVFLVLPLGGCDDGDWNPFVPCIHPVYTEADVDFDPQLVGLWTDEKAEIAFGFEKRGKSDYLLTVVEKDGDKESKGVFDAHLVRVGAFQFLDFFPGAAPDGNDFYRYHFFGAHTVARVELQGDHLHLSFLSSAWLKKRFEDKSVDVVHEDVNGTIVVTATTQELQDFVFRYATDDEAFSDPLDLGRTEITKEDE